MNLKSYLLLLLLPVMLCASIGKIVYLKGDVFLLRDKQMLKASVGTLLETKDSIITKKASLSKLLLHDNTSISVGANSEFSVSEYLFDDSQNSKVNLNVDKGVFRVITGEIGKLNSSKFKLKTKTVTIGIRGTIFTGRIAEGLEAFYCEKGVISVTSGNVTQEVPADYKTTVKNGKAPSKPSVFKNSELKKLHSEMSSWKDKKCQELP